MKLIFPKKLSGPRAYFVEFDPRKIKNISDIKSWKIRIIRRLKTLLLTKNTVVIGASHLNSRPVFELLKENPTLLEAGLILPALRSDLQCVSDCITVRGTAGVEMRNFYRDMIDNVVTWDHGFNSNGFKNGILTALSDEKSILMCNISNLERLNLNNLKKKLEDSEYLSRHEFDTKIKFLDLKNRRIIKKYANLIYYLSGANTVKSETALKNIDYMDFALSDMLGHNTNLNEENVFWKIYSELVFNTLNIPCIPLESLDILSFEDIVKIQEPIRKSGFCEKYDKMIKYAIDRISSENPISILESSEELLNLRNSIAQTFRESIEIQKAAFLRKRKRKQYVNHLSSAIHFCVGLAGLIPGVGTAFGLIGVAKAGHEILSNIEHEVDSNDILKQREKTLRRIIEGSDFSDKHLLIDVVAFISQIISSRYRF